MTEIGENIIHEAEWSLIEDTEINIKGNDLVTKLVKQVLDGEYVTIFSSDFARKILRTEESAVNEDNLANLDLQTFLKEAVELWFAGEKSSKSVKEFQILALGIACLHAFVQVNYTGPFLAFESINLLPATFRSQKDISKAILDSLNVDGERPYHLTPHPSFLLISSVLLNRPSQLPTAPWWQARVNFLHQRILGDVSAKLHDRIYSALNKARVAVESRDRDTRGRHSIEQGLVMTYYGQDNNALHKFETAGREIGLEWVLTGALGRRTKFQTFDVSQLVVLAKGRDRDTANTTDTPKPTTLDLNDDTLLEKISFTTVEKIAPTSRIPSSLSSLDPSDPTP